MAENKGVTGVISPLSVNYLQQVGAHFVCKLDNWMAWWSTSMEEWMGERFALRGHNWDKPH